MDKKRGVYTPTNIYLIIVKDSGWGSAPLHKLEFDLELIEAYDRPVLKAKKSVASEIPFGLGGCSI